MARRRRRLGAVEWVRSQAKLFILISFAFIATLFLIPNFGAYQSLINQRGMQQGEDLVVAEVGDHEVMYRDFDSKLRQLAETFTYSMQDNYGINVQLDPLEQLDRQWRAVNEILSQHALDDVARERKITVTSQEVNEFFEQQKRAANPVLLDRPANLSLLQRAFFWKEDRRIRQEFEADLKRRYGTTPNQFKEMIRDNLIRQRIVEDFQLQATDEVAAEARSLMEEFKTSFTEGGADEAPSNLKELVNAHNDANTEYATRLADGEIEADDTRITLAPTYQSREMIKRGDIAFADKLAEDTAFEMEVDQLSDVVEKEGQSLYLIHVIAKEIPDINHEKTEEIRQQLINDKRAAAAAEDEPAAEGEQAAEPIAEEVDDSAELPAVDVTVTDEEVLEELRALYTQVSFEMVKLPVPESGARLSHLITKELETREPTIHDKLVKAYDVYIDDQRDEALTLLGEYLAEYPGSTTARWFRGYLYQEMYDESLADEEAEAEAALMDEAPAEEPVEEPAPAEEMNEDAPEGEAAMEDGGEAMVEPQPEGDEPAGETPAEQTGEETPEGDTGNEAVTEGEEASAEPGSAEPVTEPEPAPEPEPEPVPEDTATFPSTGNVEFDDDLMQFWNDGWTEYQLEDAVEIPGNAEYYRKALDDYMVVVTGVNPELSAEEQEYALLQANTLDPFYNFYIGKLYESAGQNRMAYMHYRLAVVYQGDSFNLISDLRRAFNGIGATNDADSQDDAFQRLSTKITDHQQAKAMAQAAEMGDPSVNLGSGGGPNVREGVEVESPDGGGGD